MRKASMRHAPQIRSVHLSPKILGLPLELKPNAGVDKMVSSLSNPTAHPEMRRKMGAAVPCGSFQQIFDFESRLIRIDKCRRPALSACCPHPGRFFNYFYDYSD